jgi:purine-nucleoside phosphorylase
MDKLKFFKFCYGVEPENLAADVIVTPFIPLDRFKRHCRVKSEFKGKIYSGFNAERQGKKVTVVHSGLGDRLTGDAVLLLGLLPVKNIIFAGACGGLGDLKIGDLVVAESAFNGEGFSRYFDKASNIEKIFDNGIPIKSDLEFTEGLYSFTRNGSKKRAVGKGSVFTIGSLVAETKENISCIQKMSFLGVEMELSAFYRAAEVIEAKAAGLLVVSDLPLGRHLGEEFGRGEREVMKSGVEDVIRLSVEFLTT